MGNDKWLSFDEIVEMMNKEGAKMGKIIFDTGYDTLGAKLNGVEYITIPYYEEEKIVLYKLPTGDAGKVGGLVGLPEDAEFIDKYDTNDEKENIKIFEQYGITDSCEMVYYRMLDIMNNLEKHI